MAIAGLAKLTKKYDPRGHAAFSAHVAAFEGELGLAGPAGRGLHARSLAFIKSVVAIRG